MAGRRARHGRHLPALVHLRRGGEPVRAPAAPLALDGRAARRRQRHGARPDGRRDLGAGPRRRRGRADRRAGPGRAGRRECPNVPRAEGAGQGPDQAEGSAQDAHGLQAAQPLRLHHDPAGRR